MTVHYDLHGIRRGNTYERLFRFKDGAGNPVDLTGSEIIFIAETDDLDHPQDDGGQWLADASACYGRGDPEIHTRRNPPLCRGPASQSRYEIERRIGGKEFTILSGCLIVVQGVNDDA